MGWQWKDDWSQKGLSSSAKRKQGRRAYLVCSACGHWCIKDRKNSFCECGRRFDANGVPPKAPPGTDTNAELTNPVLLPIRELLSMDPTLHYLQSGFSQLLRTPIPAPAPEVDKAQKWKASLARVSSATAAFRQKEFAAAKLEKRVGELEAQLTKARADLSENETQRVVAKEELDQALEEHHALQVPVYEAPQTVDAAMEVETGIDPAQGSDEVHDLAERAAAIRRTLDKAMLDLETAKTSKHRAFPGSRCELFPNARGGGEAQS